MYNLAAYGEMSSDPVRVEAYQAALRKEVKPGMVVAEIGTGPGMFSVLACQLGARRVFAIESSEIIQVAREIAAVNRCGDRIEFIEGLSMEAVLPERADVLISDLHGVLPLLTQHIPSIVDARSRLLKPGGILIPRRDTIWAAIVEAPEAYTVVVGPWEHNLFGQDLSPARRRAVNGHLKRRAKREDMLTVAKLWATIDYGTVETPDFRGELQWTVERDGTGHGMAVWFDGELAEGVKLSNAPGEPKTVYSSFFFPWETAVSLTAGATVEVLLDAKLTASDYEWRWKTCVRERGSSGKVLADFDQSSLAGKVVSLTKLRKAASDHVPLRSEEARIDLRILELMDGRTSVQSIASQLAAEFPEQFQAGRDALARVGSLSQKYSR